MAGTVVDCDGSDGHVAGECSPCAGGQHNNGSGDSVSGERSACHGNAGVELAIVHDGERPAGSSRQYDGDNSTGWICERESCSEPGGDAGGTVLHGGLLPERRDDEHPVLGGSGGGSGDAGAGTGAVDAGGAGGAV